MVLFFLLGASNLLLKFQNLMLLLQVVLLDFVGIFPKLVALSKYFSNILIVLFELTFQGFHLGIVFLELGSVVDNALLSLSLIVLEALNLNNKLSVVVLSLLEQGILLS